MNNTHNRDVDMDKIIAEVMKEEQEQKQLEKERQRIQECDEPEWRACPEKCSGCIKRSWYWKNQLIEHGCKYCDENWDCPELVP